MSRLKNGRAMELFSSNEWVVKSAIKKFRFSDNIMDMEDAYQVASMELWRAAKEFDDSKGIKFSTYAFSCVRGALMNTDAKHNKYGFRISRRKCFKYRKLANDLNQGESLDKALINNDCTMDEYVSFRGVLEPVSNLEYTVDIGGSEVGTLADVIDSGERVDCQDNYNVLVNEIKGLLSDFEYEVVQLTIEGLSTVKIADKLECTQSKAYRALKAAREKIYSSIDGIPSKYMESPKERRKKFVDQVFSLYNNNKALTLKDIADITGQPLSTIDMILFRDSRKNKKTLEKAI